MGRSQLEVLVDTEEGQQALEDALVRWVEVKGEHPSDEDLEMIANIVNTERSTIRRWTLNVTEFMFYAIFVIWIVSSMFKSFSR